MSTRRAAKIDTTGKPWAIYLRLSKAEAAEVRGLSKEQRTVLTNRKLDRHLADIIRWLDSKGFPHRDDLVFRDPGLSAWKPSVRRPQWEAMMEIARQGEIAGIGVLAVDRYTRIVTVMEEMISLAQRIDIKIGGGRAGVLDLTTYEGIQQARGMAMQAANESLATSFRLKESLAWRMKAGKPMGGGRSFGFEVVADDTVTEVPQVPEEVAVIREMAGRMLAGEPLQHLAADMNKRGLKTTRGGEWTGANLGRMLGLARYGGEVVHEGKVVATMPGEPILDRDTYDAVKVLLMSRRRGRRPTGRFLLTGLLTCSACQRPMNGAVKQKPLADGTKPREYRCPRQQGGCGMSINADGVEKKVGKHMVALLSDPDEIERIVTESAELGQARAEAQARLDGVAHRRRNLTAKYSAEEIEDDEYEEGLAILARQRAKAQAALDAVAPAAAMVGYDAGADWFKASDEEKRTMVRQHRVRIEILPHRGARRFDPERVQIP